MNDAGIFLAVVGFLAAIPLGGAFAVLATAAADEKKRRIPLRLLFMWAVVFGPFVLRTWFEALLS